MQNRIIQISHLYRPSIGGIENYIYRLNNSIRESGNEVSTITTDMSLANSNSPLEREPNTTYCKTTGTVLRNPLSIELIREIRRCDGDIYHLHSPWYFTSLEAALSLPKNAPMIMTIHGVAHGVKPIKKGFFSRLATVMYKPFAQFVMNRIDRIIVLGDSEKQLLLKYFDIPPNDIFVIPNGINIDDFSVSTGMIENFHRKYDINAETPTILNVGRLVELKNPHLLVDAITENFPDKDLEVVIVGNGDEEYSKKLRKRADSRFRFISNLTVDYLRAAYHATDVFVLLSSIEGLPTVVLEAMCASCPIISTNAGALEDALTHGEHGHMLKLPIDTRDVADALGGFFDCRERWKKIGKHNQKYVSRRFSWEKIADEIINNYHALDENSRY